MTPNMTIATAPANAADGRPIGNTRICRNETNTKVTAKMIPAAQGWRKTNSAG
jgi:hypothetical protein